MTIALTQRMFQSGTGFFRDRARRRRMASLFGLGLAIAAPVCGIVTYLLATGNGPFGSDPATLRLFIVVDFCLALALLGVIAWRIGAMVIARRARSAGSRLHLRMVRLFTIVAVAPALLLGLFAAITVTWTLEGWLNENVGGFVRNSVRIAESYVDERHQTIVIDASSISQEIERSSPYGVPGQQEITLALAKGSISRGLTEVYVINSSGEIIARGPNSYLFLYDPPAPAHIQNVQSGRTYVFEDPATDSVRALVRLSGVFDAYLYLVRPVDDEAAQMLVETRAMAERYERLEAQRGDIQLLFALLYMGFAVLVLSAAIWFGIWFADRLARPVGRLAGAADRVAKGDLGARVQEEHGDDEIATLSRAFNRMTSQVERQRDALLDANSELEHRRRFTEAVLSGVTVGVIGFDPSGRVDLLNAAAEGIVGVADALRDVTELNAIMPGSEALLDAAARSPTSVSESRLVVVSGDAEREFLVRVACQRTVAGIEGYVMTVDDMTALVSAQRSAAWGDVARRVAHEIRNPLTPIQLSAERLKRKFGKEISENRPVFEHCVDTIVRQVQQIRRMVEEFSNFARMPTPEFSENPLESVLAECVELQAAAHPDTAFIRAPEHVAATLYCDRGLISQALTNLLRNAAQSVAARHAAQTEAGEEPEPGRIEIETDISAQGVRLSITDNGTGFPKQDRNKLLEPYVTSRKGGTGLGLAIVNRIVEDHAGRLVLDDAPGGMGARVTLTLPRSEDFSGRVARMGEIGEIPGRIRAAAEAAE